MARIMRIIAVFLSRIVKIRVIREIRAKKMLSLQPNRNYNEGLYIDSKWWT